MLAVTNLQCNQNTYQETSRACRNASNLSLLQTTSFICSSSITTAPVISLTVGRISLSNAKQNVQFSLYFSSVQCTAAGRDSIRSHYEATLVAVWTANKCELGSKIVGNICTWAKYFGSPGSPTKGPALRSGTNLSRTVVAVDKDDVVGLGKQDK